MKTIANIIWLVLNGIWMAAGWLLIGGLLAITIVGLPFARQCLKFARFALWPFGRTVVKSPNASVLGPVGNVLWFIPGVFLAIGYAVSGIALFLTIIGIPFGIQSFKFIPLALSPFGKEIVEHRAVSDALAAARAGAIEV